MYKQFGIFTRLQSFEIVVIFSLRTFKTINKIIKSSGDFTVFLVP